MVFDRYSDSDNEAAEKETKTFVSVTKATDKAILFNFGPNSAWLPKSKIDVDYENLEVVFPAWLTLNYIRN